MSLTQDETVSYIGDAIDALSDRVQAFTDASTLDEFADAVRELESMVETETGYLEQAKTAVEDREFLDEWSAGVADDLEADMEDVCADLPGEFREGFEAAIQWIRDNY
jgi:hypothetical protein